MKTTAAKKSTSTVTEAKTMRPRPKPAYRGATADPDADKRVALAALVMLGHDKGSMMKSGTGNDEDDEELTDDEEGEEEIEEVEGDGLMNEVGGFEGIGNSDSVEREGGNDDDTSCEYGSSHFIERILTLLFQHQSPFHLVLKPFRPLILNLKCLAA
jgi:hypothetical protein